MFIHLDDKEKTDLLMNYDQIIAALNFIRFMAILDTSSKFRLNSNLWEHIEENYLAPLHKGIELTKAHHELELKRVKETRHNNKKRQFSVNTLDMKEQQNVLTSAICSVDMMASLVFRVRELVKDISHNS